MRAVPVHRARVSAAAIVDPRSFSFVQSLVVAQHRFFSRLLEAMLEARRRQADREITRHLRIMRDRPADNGWRELERRTVSGM